MKKLILSALMLFLIFEASAQMQISGKVTHGETGEPIPGVSIVVKSQPTIGTTTDMDGNYTLTGIPSTAKKLIFSFVGMTEKEMDISGRSTINVEMEPSTLDIAEVVVTGVGSATDKRKIGMSVEDVDPDEFSETASASLDQAIAGKIAGAQIQSVTGQPGQQQSIQLRGINAFGSTMPMIMVDGVQINTDQNFNGSASNQSSRFADLDMSEIERVEVVQGAAAATIYGAQGANGVIQIFTKKGKAGQTKVNFSSKVSFESPLTNNYQKADRHYYMTDSEGYILSATDPAEVRMHQQENGVWTEPLGSIDGSTVVNKPFKEETFNQLDQALKDQATTYHNNLSVSGGSEDVQFHTSLSHLNQGSIIQGNYEKMSLRANLTFNLADNLQAFVRSNVITSDNTTGTTTGIDSRYSPLGYAVNSPQYVDLTFRDPLGNYVASPINDNSINALYSFENRSYSSQLTRLIQNVGFQYEMTNVLRFDVKYGYDAYKNRFRDIIVNQENFMSNGLNPNEGQYDQDYYEGTTQNFIGSAFLDIDFQKDMNSSIPLKSVTMFKYDWRQRDYERTSAYGSGLPQFEHFTQEQVSNVVADAYKSVFRTYGFLINEKLEYADFVGASFGVRADWSSAFGEGSDPFIFPRGDFFLRVSELPFFSSLKNVIPEFKLRTAYGEAGIQPDPFDRIITLSTGTIGSGTYLTGQTSLTNPKLGVQVSKEFEVGADIAFTLGDDFMHYGQFNITYWDRKGEDVIEYIQIPTSTGGVEILDNAFAIESSGIQMSLDLNMLNTNKFKWNTVFNFGTSESILTYVSNGVPQAVGNNFVLKEGEPIGTFYGYMPLTSLDQLDAQGNRYIPESEVSNYSISSSGYVVHNDSKAVQFTSDKREVGNPQPDFNLSWINRFSFGNVVDLSVQVDMVQGKDIYNQTRQWQYRDMLHTDVTNPVSINGDNQPWAAYYRSLYQTNQPNAYFVEDGSYIRLRDVRLTFKLGELLDYAFLRNADLTIAGRNLFTITDYTGFDPEAASVDTDDTYVIGLDQYAFPNYKSYHIGLKIGF